MRKSISACCSTLSSISSLLHESEYDMVKYFMTWLIYFQEPEGMKYQAISLS